MKYRIERDPDGSWIIADVWKRGHAVLTDALLNKGTAFGVEERELLELDGMLPPQVTDRERQTQRAYEGVVAKGDRPLEKYLAMVSLQDRNETLFRPGRFELATIAKLRFRGEVVGVGARAHLAFRRRFGLPARRRRPGPC